jgi:hypothetical protein
MTTKYFNSVLDRSTFTFNPLTDILICESAASLSLWYTADFTDVTFMDGIRAARFASPVSLLQLTTSNILFSNGSQLIIGDNNTDTANDNLSNTLNGGAGADQLLGLGGNDQLNGGDGNDLLNGGDGNDTLDGGVGADTMKGGLGNDTYLVDNVGDVIDESPPPAPLLVSTNDVGVQGNYHSQNAQLSSNGRYVVFESGASNLVAGDTNSSWDIFVKDLQTGAIQRVSTNSAGGEANGLSHNAQFSADDRYVVFDSTASNLVAGDTNNASDVFVKNLQTGATQRVSTDASGLQGSQGSQNGRFASDGHSVVFDSYANNLATGHVYMYSDIFLKNWQTGEIQVVSINSAALDDSYSTNGDAQISANGRYVVFESTARNLVSGLWAYAGGIFVKDLQTGTVRCASLNAAGVTADEPSYNADISADGRYVVFESAASSLVVGDTNQQTDIFVKDMQSGEIQRVSTNAAGGQTDAGSHRASISADGRYVVFDSYATNLVAGDTHFTSSSSPPDIFIKDLQTGAIQSLSMNFSGGHPIAVEGSLNAHFSADGHYVVFESSDDSKLITGDSNAVTDIFRVANPFLFDSGVGTVQSSVTYTLPNFVENLTLTGTGWIDGTGNALDNLIYAGAGNNVLDGAGGTDTVSYAFAGAGVTVSLASAGAQATGGSGSDTLLNFENLTGSAFNDNLTGNAAGNMLDSGAGSDFLNGGVGADTMLGGDGTDAYCVDHAGDLVSESNSCLATGGNDVVYSYLAAYTLTANVERLRLMLSWGEQRHRQRSRQHALRRGGQQCPRRRCRY